MRKIPTQGRSDVIGTQSASLVVNILAGHGQDANIAYHDTWAVKDGEIHIKDEDEKMVADFTVQVKTLPESGKLTFPCPVEFLEYCKTMMRPVMLLVADNTTAKVYWRYFDKKTASKVDDGTNTTTVTIDLSESQSFSSSDNSYIEDWIKLFNEKKLELDNLVGSVTSLLTGEIDYAKDLLEKFRYSEALDFLLGLKKRSWDQADDNARFRILSNIAVAQAHTDQVDEAVKSYIEGFNFQPDLQKAHANKAVAHLLKDEYAEALQEAEYVLKLNPLDVSATSTKIQALRAEGKSFDDILSAIDQKTVDEAGVASALHYVAKELGQEAEAKDYLERAAIADEKSPYIHGELGIYLLESVAGENKRVAANSLLPEQEAEVRRAIDELNVAWANMPDERDRKYHAIWLFDLVMAYRMLGLECDAEKLNDELLRLGTDNEAYILNAAAMAFKAKKYELAEGYYRELVDAGSSIPELPIMFADTLRMLKKIDEAEELCEGYIASHTEYDSIYVDIAQSLFDIYIEKGDLVKAEELTARIFKKPELVVMGSLFSARLARLKQDSDMALSYLESAATAADDKTYDGLFWGLAEEAFWLNAFNIASRAYERVVKPTSDTQFIQRYLKSLFDTREYQKVIDFAGAVRETVGSSRHITQFEWSAYLELQNLPKARKVLEDYVGENPEDEGARLSLALIYFRSHDLKSLDAYLNEPIDLEKLDLTAEAQLSNLYQTRKNPKRALEIVYDLRRRHINDADAHSAYVSIFMGLEDSVTKLLNVKNIQPNSVFFYKGGHFMIEADYDPQLSENEISPTEADKRGFTGMKKGELITLSENQFSGKNEVKITEVMSKYVYALQDSMQNFERRFSDRHDMMGFNIGDNNFAPLFKQLDQRQKLTQNIEDLYKQGKITIDLFAKLAGRNAIETFYALRGTPDLGVRVADGTLLETTTVNKLTASMSDETIVVADLTALITLFELGLRPQNIGLSKLFIAQSIKDSILEAVARMQSMGLKPQMTLYKSGGHYIRQEITSKEQQQRLSHVKKFSKWVDDNTIVAAISQKQLDAVAEKSVDYDKLNELLNNAQLDSMKLAIGENRILYSDDVGLRSLSTNTFGTEGIWTQPLIAHQSDAGYIDKEEYQRISVDLVKHNYHYVAINAQTLMYAAKTASWQPQEPLISVLRTLSPPETSTVSIAIVISDFLYELYKRTTLTDKSLIVHQILSEATRHHDTAEVISLLQKGVSARFKLMPQQQSEIKDAISAWQALHSV
jgi:tetratricopeptide (TPR) repeat protein